MKYLFKNLKAIATFNKYGKCSLPRQNLNSGKRVAKLRQLQLGILSLIGVASVLVLPNSVRAATTTLNFNDSSPTLVSGAALSQGAVYRFQNVATGVDALVTIAQISNSQLVSLDDNTSLATRFQPTIRQIGANNTSYIRFNFQLVVSGTSTPTSVSNLYFSAQDVDGNGVGNGVREFVEIINSQVSYVANPTLLTSVSALAGGVRYQQTNSSNVQAGIGTDDQYEFYSYVGTSVSNFSVIGGSTSGIDTTCNSTDNACNRLNSWTFNILDVQPLDFGDAPSSYGNVSHPVPATPSVYFGAAVDGDDAPNYSANADGDDIAGTDDEDGVASFPALITTSTTYSVTASCKGTSIPVAAWIDFNRNGVFDTGERTSGTCNNTSVTLNWTGLTGLSAGKTYARLRIASNASEVTSPSTSASNGEVEDYSLDIANPINISGTLYRDNDRNSTNNSEPGIGNIRVILYKDNDNNREIDTTSEVIQQVTTLANGTYQFTNVAAGTYKIKVDIADTDVPVGYTLGTSDNLTVTVNTTSITGQDFGFYPVSSCEWDAQIYSGHFPISGTQASDTGAVGLFGTTGLPTLRGTAKFGAGSSAFTFNDQSIPANGHPLRTIINGTFPSSGYVAINGDYISPGNEADQPNWAIVFKRQALAKGRVTLGQTGAYIDDSMEIYINGVRVGNPVLTFTPSLAANQVSTVSVNAGDIIEIRLSNFGNIGGFVVTTDFVSDFGDAPNSYGEPSHAISCSNPRLGATVSGENSQSYTANGDGDAGDDGVTLPSSLAPGKTATIIVNASTAGFLNSWIDFNKNGVFDSGEQLSLTNVTNGTAATVNNVPLNAGNNTLTFTVPSNATVGSSFARFRFTPSAVATPSPTGSGGAGEVEDYQVAIANPVTISGTVFSDADADVTINGSDGGTNAGSANLTIYAIDTAGKVLDKATVAAIGTYSLANVPANSSVTLRLSNDSTVAIGATAPTAPSIPSGWYHTGKNLNGTIDGTIATLGNIALTTTTSNLINQNFGIRQAYTITADPAPTICNPDYRTALNTGITAAGGQLAVGTNDLNWTAEWIAGPASGVGTPYAPPRPVGPMPAVVIGNLAPGNWVNQPANANWISYPFRLSTDNSNGRHNSADLDGINGEDGSGIAIVGTSDAVRLKFTSNLTLPSNANTISISLPVGVAIDNQFVSIKINGVENLVPTPAPNSQATDFGSFKTVNMTNGWQAGVNTIEIVLDSGPPLAGFLLAVQATTTQVCGKSNVVLVKRITAINGVSTINPSDNTTQLNQVLDNPATPNDDATVKWPPGYLVGAFNAGKIKPGDVLEYTVYFLNAKGANANTVKICDRIIGSQTYKTGSLEIRLGNATSSISLSDAADPALDRGQFYPSSASAPAACNLITPGTGVADNGTWAVDVTGTGSSAQPNFTTMPSATAPGTPTASYGFIRFKNVVNP